MLSSDKGKKALLSRLREDTDVRPLAEEADGLCLFSDSTAVLCKGGVIRVFDLETGNATDSPFEGQTLSTLAKGLSHPCVNDSESCVPILCSSCFRHTEEDFETMREAVRRRGPASKWFVGTAGTFDSGQQDYEFQISGLSEDVPANSLVRYYLPLDSLRYIQHRKPDRLLFDHNESGDVGAVACYWHVHHPDAKVACVNAIAYVNEESPYAREFWETAADQITGFSWGSLRSGDNELVTELSVVLLAGRKGCFATKAEGVEEVLEKASRLCFQAEPATKVCANFFAGGVVDERTAGTPSRFVEHYKDSLRNMNELLRVLYRNKGRTNIEEYIARGIKQFESLHGQKATGEVVPDWAKSSIKESANGLQTKASSSHAMQTNGSPPVNPVAGAPLPWQHNMWQPDSGSLLNQAPPNYFYSPRFVEHLAEQMRSLNQTQENKKKEMVDLVRSVLKEDLQSHLKDFTIAEKRKRTDDDGMDDYAKKIKRLDDALLSLAASHPKLHQSQNEPQQPMPDNSSIDEKFAQLSKQVSQLSGTFEKIVQSIQASVTRPQSTAETTMQQPRDADPPTVKAHFTLDPKQTASDSAPDPLLSLVM
ncbi:UNVERIFIED_CONTAM: hypothetical protein FKN15_019684 [Acipenser sinensis]